MNEHTLIAAAQALEAVAELGLDVAAWPRVERYTGEPGIWMGSPGEKIGGFGLTAAEALADLGETLMGLHPEVSVSTPDQEMAVKAVAIIERWVTTTQPEQFPFDFIRLAETGRYRVSFRHDLTRCRFGEGPSALEAVINAAGEVEAGLARLAEFKADPRGFWLREMERRFPRRAS